MSLFAGTPTCGEHPPGSNRAVGAVSGLEAGSEAARYSGVTEVQICCLPPKAALRRWPADSRTRAQNPARDSMTREASSQSVPQLPCYDHFMKAVVRYENGLHEIIALIHCRVYPPTIRISIENRVPRLQTDFDRNGWLKSGTPLYVQRVLKSKRNA